MKQPSHMVSIWTNLVKQVKHLLNIKRQDKIVMKLGLVLTSYICSKYSYMSNAAYGFVIVFLSI